MKGSVPQAEIKRFKAAAKTAGIKLTTQRLEIFKEIASRADHPTAEVVYDAVKRILPTVSLDTVYRSLWTFADLGLIGTLGPRTESQRFDGNGGKHHHFICLGCGRVTDFLSGELDALRLPEAARAIGRVERAQVEVSGYCVECEKARAVPPADRQPSSDGNQEGSDGGSEKADE